MSENWKWRSVLYDPPIEGVPVYIVNPNNNQCDVAYYCNREFYKLELDETLGVLRKVIIDGSVVNWTTI